MKPEELMLISAVRYALGRMSYIVKDTCDFVLFNRSKLSENCRRIIIKDIEDELDRYHSCGKTLGMDFDERNWMFLLDTLESELK